MSSSIVCDKAWWTQRCGELFWHANPKDVFDTRGVIIIYYLLLLIIIYLFIILLFIDYYFIIKGGKTNLSYNCIDKWLLGNDGPEIDGHRIPQRAYKYGWFWYNKLFNKQ
jgi:hypothetical protein